MLSLNKINFCEQCYVLKALSDYHSLNSEESSIFNSITHNYFELLVYAHVFNRKCYCTSAGTEYRITNRVISKSFHAIWEDRNVGLPSHWTERGCALARTVSRSSSAMGTSTLNKNIKDTTKFLF